MYFNKSHRYTSVHRLTIASIIAVVTCNPALAANAVPTQCAPACESRNTTVVNLSEKVNRLTQEMDAYLGLFSDSELFKTTDLRWAEMDATFSSVLLAANNEAAAAAPKRLRLAARKYALGLQAFGSATKMAIAEMRNINDLARQANEIELGAYTLSFNTSRQIAEPIIKKEMKEHTEKVMASKKRLEDTLMSLHTRSLDIFRTMTELQQANKSDKHLAEHPIADMSDKMKKALTVTR